MVSPRGESVIRAKSVIPKFTYDEKGMGTLKPVWLKWELVNFFQQAKNQDVGIPGLPGVKYQRYLIFFFSVFNQMCDWQPPLIFVGFSSNFLSM